MFNIELCSKISDIVSNINIFGDSDIIRSLWQNIFMGELNSKVYSMNILTCIQIHRNLINVNSVHIFISWCREPSLQRETSKQERFFFISIFFHVLICSDRHEWNIISISFHSQRRIRNFKDIFWQIFDLELVNTPLIALFLRYLSKFIGLGIFFFFSITSCPLDYQFVTSSACQWNMHKLTDVFTSPCSIYSFRMPVKFTKTFTVGISFDWLTWFYRTVHHHEYLI